MIAFCTLWAVIVRILHYLVSTPMLIEQTIEDYVWSEFEKAFSW